MPGPDAPEGAPRVPRVPKGEDVGRDMGSRPGFEPTTPWFVDVSLQPELQKEKPRHFERGLSTARCLAYGSAHISSSTLSTATSTPLSRWIAGACRAATSINSVSSSLVACPTWNSYRPGISTMNVI